MEEADNSIFIGTKPFMNYVTGVVIQFTTKNAKEVFVKARGKFISRAVDVSEISVKRFLKDQIKVKNTLKAFERPSMNVEDSQRPQGAARNSGSGSRPSNSGGQGGGTRPSANMQSGSPHSEMESMFDQKSFKFSFVIVEEKDK
jgi:DNA-binding protein